VIAQELIAALEASQVRRLAVVQRAGRWEVWAHLGPTLEDASGDRVDPTRWDTLDGAYSWIRKIGYRETVEVDDASAIAGEYGFRVFRDPAGQWCYRVIDPSGLEVAGGGGFGLWEDARQAAIDMTLDFKDAVSDPVFGDVANTKARGEYSSHP